MNPKIFVSISTFAEYDKAPLDLLKESGFPYFLNPLGRRLNREEIVEMGRDCEGVIAGVEPYDDFVLDRMPNLRCISRCGVGIDNISIAKAKEKGIEIRNTPNVVIQPVAELTVAMIFDLLKKLSYHTTLLRSKRWEKSPGFLLTGKKVGILGLGRIGKKVAEIMLKLDTEVCGADLFPDLEWARGLNVKIVPFGELFRLSDILTIHVSIDREQPLRIGEKEIRSMKKGAILINTARGQIIDEKALYEALREEHLGGAALDVFPEEPYHGRLCELDNLVLTPHVATLTKESRIQMELEATSNLITFFKS
ncbi:MAG: phosphoglycerate dehydrogenase [Thermodesulfobacteriota bacterium]